MLISDTVKSLLENDKELCRSAVNILLKIANNIISYPQENKFRNISLSAEVMKTTLLPALGALEVLFMMGFKEGSDRLVLASNANLDTVTLYRDQLEQLKRESIPEKAKPVPKSEEKVTVNAKKKKKKLNDSDIAQFAVSETKVRKELEHQFQQVLIFEDPRLHQDAKKAMPYATLTEKAKERVVELEKYKQENATELNPFSPVDLQECIIVELLDWFKGEFFSWFDQGYCETCSKNMKFLGFVSPTADESAPGGHRVEHYQCESCSSVVRFPRYFHPGKLLQTRKGRCMEWASCFTLMCRAIGVDSRYVWDSTDHVWSELFSPSENRWIAADPCENKLDCSLLYEAGWNKKLSYIFAFSKDEVVDCVWRYSAQHEAVCQRRTRCREDWLAATLHTMNEERQKSFPQERKSYLEKRLVEEIVEFLSPPKVRNDSEVEGRLSGSLSWRLNRGESSVVPYTFVPTKDEVEANEMVVQYSSSKDLYFRGISGAEEMKEWKSGVYAAKNVLRKHEKDWHMVYLARTDGTSEGEVRWRFDWSSANKKVKSVSVVFEHKTYEDGAVHWQVCAGEACFMGNKEGVLELSEADLSAMNTSYLEVVATLEKGKGDVAWQHAQLFRQKDREEQRPFSVKIKFE